MGSFNQRNDFPQKENNESIAKEVLLFANVNYQRR